MKIYRGGLTILALLLAAMLAGSLTPAGALAQCNGHSGDMNGHHMSGQGYMGPGYMDSGHMGQYGGPMMAQSDQGAAAPNYVNPVPPPVSMPDTTAGSGEMMGYGSRKTPGGN